MAFTVGKDGARHAEESMKFIEFLMRPEIVETYITDQTAMPTLKGAKPTSRRWPAWCPTSSRSKLVGFTDHHIPPASASMPCSSSS